MDTESQSVLFAAERPASSHCFSLAKRSLLAIEIQIDRIWSPAIDAGENPLLPYEVKLIDVHFYFVAIRNLYRYLNKIISDPVYSELEPQLDVLNEKWFKHYSKGREAFEHIDQRFPNEKHEEKLVEIEENGARRKVHFGLSMKNGLFTHSNESWDISIPTFTKLKEDVTNFIQSIVESSNKKLNADGVAAAPPPVS